MPAEAGTALLVAIDSLAERDARRERAQNTRAQGRHEQIRAAGGRVDRAVAERCAEDAAVGLARERTAARRIAALGALAEARVTLDRRPGDPPRREVVVHVDAAVLADDTAAGRAHFEGGPAITGAQARRMLCEATAVVMLEQGGEPLAVGRRRRRATKAQRRALLRRDGGCARPGCPETRIERLHAHHMRHWLFGGRTELANLVLLCDTDHGLVHDHDLVLSRRNGRLIVLTPDGRRIWGTADAAFRTGLPGVDTTRPPIPPGSPTRSSASTPSTPPSAGAPPTRRRPTRMPRSRHRPGDHSAADRARRDAHQSADPPNGAPPHPADTPAGPDARPPGGPAAAPPSGQPPRGDRLERAPASAAFSSPTANRPSPTRCRSATTAWISATPSAC